MKKFTFRIQSVTGIGFHSNPVLYENIGEARVAYAPTFDLLSSGANIELINLFRDDNGLEAVLNIHTSQIRNYIFWIQEV